MSLLTTDHVMTEAMSLPIEARAYIAERLLASLDQEDEISPEWMAELERRRADYKAGKTTAIPMDEMMGKTRAALRSVRG